ncbi:phospholipid-binding protein MlaC [Thermodesulfobacteriota bacterium]
MIARYIILIIFLTLPLQAHAGKPLDTVQVQVEKILDILRDPGLKAKSAEEVKKDRIWEIIGTVFDYNELSRRALGRNWKKLDASQQKEFTDLFSRLLGNIYLGRIIAYTDEKVVFDKEKMLAEDKAEVQSRIVTASKEIPLNYRLILKGGEWRVYDVAVEGISLVRNYRTQFRDIFKKKSPEDLLEMLRKKVAKL